MYFIEVLIIIWIHFKAWHAFIYFSKFLRPLSSCCRAKSLHRPTVVPLGPGTACYTLTTLQGVLVPQVTTQLTGPECPPLGGLLGRVRNTGNEPHM